MDRPILVIGAGGHFGRYVPPALLARGLAVRGFIHHDRAEEVARSVGVKDIVRGDLRDLASLHRALEGVVGVFYIPPKFLPDEADLGVRLVGASADAGVSKFVLSGVMYPFITDMCNHREKLPVELALIKSGLNFTILHPTNLIQSTGVFFWEKVLATGEYIEPWAQDKKSGWVDYRDVAEVAAIAFSGNSLDNAIFDLSSKDVLSRDDMVEMMSQILGRTITTRTQPVENWNEENLPPDAVLRDAFAGIDRFYSRYGFPGGNDLVLRTILGREPRRVFSYLEELAAGPAST